MYKVKRTQRHQKIRKKISGTTARPRLAVCRSSQHIYVQLIDDSVHKTVVSASDLGLTLGTKTEKAAQVGEDIAKKALTQKIKKVVFDRGGMPYHGRVAALAAGARKAGLEF